MRALFFLLNDLLLFLLCQTVLPIPSGIKVKPIFLSPGTAIVTEVIQPAVRYLKVVLLLLAWLRENPERHTLFKKIGLRLACAFVFVFASVEMRCCVLSCFCAD